MLKKLCCAFILAMCVLSYSTYAAEIDFRGLNHPSAHVKEQRKAYIEARDAIKQGDNSKAIAYKKTILKDYPLNVWLDYYMLSVDPDVKKFRDVIKFIKDKRHTELGTLLQDKYITYLANIHDYEKVNVLLPTKPYLESEAKYAKQKGKLCRFYEAKWALNLATEDAVAYASSLYLGLKAIPRECNGLMAFFDSKGYLTDKIKLDKFERSYILQGYANSTKSLAKELQRTPYAARIKAQMSLYKKPESIFKDDFVANSASDRRIAVLAFKRYANISATDARNSLDAFVLKFKPTDVELVSIEQIIAKNCLGRYRPLADVKWVDDNLPAVGWTEELKELRLRRAIWFSQWGIVYNLLNHMSDSFQHEVNWRYWKGISAIKLGYKEQGVSILKEVAKDRSFFGFMAAQKLKLPYAYNHLKLSDRASWQRLISTNPSVKRFFELDALDDSNAIFEWREIAKSSSDDDAMLMAQWALQTGKIAYAIDSVVAAKRWDALSYRFPLAYFDDFRCESRAQNVPLSFLYGISRQESMLNAKIRSPVGATGLMQLMPGTARLVARQNKWRYRGVRDLVNPKLNIKFGTAYIKDMLESFDNNRLLAAAAYNAGPGRIPKWVSNDGKARQADAFVECIPFYETRHYVQNVILYDAIYNYLITGKQGTLLKPHEITYKY